MKTYFKESEKEFIKYIKKNPFCTVQQWDYYAESNRLYSANTLRAHIITEETEDLIRKINIHYIAKHFRTIFKKN